MEMKMLTIKPGTKVRTKSKINQLKRRYWSVAFCNSWGTVVGTGKPGMIKISMRGHIFDVWPEELVLNKPIKLKKFSAWK